MKLDDSRPILPPLPPAEYAQLRESIRLHGVLTPLLITDDDVIIDGHERYKVIRELKIKEFPWRAVGHLSRSQRVEYTIRANAERRHLTRVERQELLKKYVRAAPEKSTREVADTLRISPSSVSRAKRSAGVSSDIRGRDGKVYRHKPAVSGETHAARREATRLLQQLPPGSVSGGISTRKLRRKLFDQQCEKYARGPLAELPPTATIHQGDFREVGRQILPKSVDVAVGDPPWMSEYWDLLPELAREYYRIMKSGAPIAIYSGHTQVPLMMQAFLDVGFKWLWLVACVNPEKDAGNRQSGQGRNGGQTSNLVEARTDLHQAGQATAMDPLAAGRAEGGSRAQAFPQVAAAAGRGGLPAVVAGPTRLPGGGPDGGLGHVGRRRPAAQDAVRRLRDGRHRPQDRRQRVAETVPSTALRVAK